MVRLAVDECVDNDIVRGLQRSRPTVDVLRVQDVGLSGASDREVLAWADREQRVLVTHDYRFLQRRRRGGGRASRGLRGTLPPALHAKVKTKNSSNRIRDFLVALALACSCHRHDPPRGSPPIDVADPLAAIAPPGAPPVPPRRPTYDLDEELASRLNAARSLFGPGTASDVVAGVFLIVSPHRDSAYQASVALARSALDALYNDRFSARLDEAVTVFVFVTKPSYDAFCKQHFEGGCTSPLGCYDRGRREIVVNVAPGISTLTHELVHPIVRNDFPGVPQWFNEGLASLFEQPVLPRRGEIHGAKNWRLPRLLAALASKTERTATRLDALFGMTDVDFERDEDLHMAMARYACQWLDEQGKLWTFYRAWRDAGSSDESGAKAFVQAVGMTPEQANEPWVRWVRGL
jgi:hypothetical protein